MFPGLTAVTNFDGGTPSWIELYNPTVNTIDLAGMSLSDTPTTPRKWVFPADVSMAPNSYRLVLFDPSQPASTTAVALLNTGFGIADNGGEVYLYAAGVGGAQLDGLAYGVQAVEYSIGRVPSAGTNWTLNLPTPGSGNTPASLGLVSQLRVNEWMANPSEGEDWFEIYNPGSQPVDLSGLYLTDDLSTPESRKKFKVAPLSFIGSGLYGFQRFWADNAAVAAPDHCNFALRLSGEYLGIFKEGDVRIDFVFFLTQDLDVSQGRLPDGSTNITRFVSTASPGDANYLLLTNVVINEVLSYAPAGWPLEQAIELRNLGNTTVNIGGWFLSNQRRHLKKFRITDGTTLTPGQFKVYYQNQFYFDPMNASNFLLDSTEGDSLYLSVADANANLTGYRSAVKFGAPDAGVSFGRYTNSVGQVDFTAMTQHTFGVSNPDTVTQFRTGTGHGQRTTGDWPAGVHGDHVSPGRPGRRGGQRAGRICGDLQRERQQRAVVRPGASDEHVAAAGWGGLRVPA